MAGSIEITAKPTVEELKREAERKRQELRQFRTLYSRASVFLDQWVQKNFQSSGGKVGGWKPFSPRTLEYIAKNDPGRLPAKLLMKTGRLRASFMPFATDEDAGIGSRLEYSAIHQKGRGRIPARPMLPTAALVRDDIRRIFKDRIAEVIEK